MRSMKRVLIGSLAAARSSASRATWTDTPSISNSTRPGLMRHTHSSGVPLPLPMRTSIGFFDTGTSGKMRIHTRPARFMWRVIARRAASIWRALTRSGSSALSPNCPNVSELPEVATPRMRPLWALRNLVRLGCSIVQTLSFRTGTRSGVAARPRGIALGHPLVLRHRVVLHDLAFEDPHLHAAGAVGGERGGDPVIDVGAQRMQRHAALAVPLHARDLGAAEPARAVDADPFRPEPHRRLDGALHGAAERHPALELLRDRLGDELGVELGLPDLDDVDHHVGIGEVGHLAAQLLNVGALLADDHARPRRMDRHPALLVRTLDHDLRHRRLLELLHQLFADLHVLVQELAVVVLAGIPARVPGPVDAEPQPDRIDLLTHETSSSPRLDLTHDDRQVRERLVNAPGPATRARREALHDEPLAHMRLDDDQIVDVEVVIVLGVGDRRFQALAHVLGDALARELEIGERSRHRLAADQRRQQVELLRAHPDVAGDGLRLVVGEAAIARFLAHGLLPLAFRWSWWCASPCGPPHGRRTCASARTRRTCGRPSLPSPAREYASARCRHRMSGRRTAAGWSSGGSRS